MRGWKENGDTVTERKIIIQGEEREDHDQGHVQEIEEERRDIEGDMRRVDQEIEEEATERVIGQEIGMKSPHQNHQRVQRAIQGGQVIKNSL